jgi:HD superfamily phosphodiesterase
LWEQEGGDEFVVLAGAWVHDVSLAEGADDHPSDVARLTRLFLARFRELDDREIREIVACARGHESGGADMGLEAMIVHDADALDKGGILGVIRHTWKMTNLLDKRTLNTETDVLRLQDHLKRREEAIFTKTARDLMERLSRCRDAFFADGNFSLKTIKWVSALAKEGVTADRIAEILVEKEGGEIADVLKRQLRCDDLSFRP